MRLNGKRKKEGDHGQGRGRGGIKKRAEMFRVYIFKNNWSLTFH